MQLSRLAAAGIALGAAVALALAGVTPASAALLLPTSYPHLASLTDGVLTVTVANETSKTATCWLSVHDASTQSQLSQRAATVNTEIAGGIESPVLSNARAAAAQGALHILANGVSVASDSSRPTVWASGRTDTSYAIYQECTTPDPVLGLTINGLAQVYTVTGTGFVGQFANVTAAPTVSGTGRLGTSFTASYDASGVTPAPTSVAFRWHTPGGTVVGTGASFTPTIALLGQSLYATAVLSRADYEDHVTLGSALTAVVAHPEPVLGANTQTVEAGGFVTDQAQGLLVGEEYTVELHSDPVVLGTAVSDAAGEIRATFRIPSSVAPGRHTLVLLYNGVAIDTMSLTVTARPSLAATGAATGPVGLAAVLLIAGIGALAASRVASRRSRGASV